MGKLTAAIVVKSDNTISLANSIEKQLQKLNQANNVDQIGRLTSVDTVKDAINQILYIDTNGQITRYKTGAFKTGSPGIADVAAPKKEPIQFWN
jgi:hypothetical protein